MSKLQFAYERLEQALYTLETLKAPERDFTLETKLQSIEQENAHLRTLNKEISEKLDNIILDLKNMLEA